jgi:hypothetical protein
MQTLLLSTGAMGRHFYYLLLMISAVWAAETISDDPFRQLTCELPTANSCRTASGSPGEGYWQQQADYDIRIELNDTEQRIYGSETITYYNNSPHILSYLWLQLDQNIQCKDADKYLTKTDSLSGTISSARYQQLLDPFNGGFQIESMTDGSDNMLDYYVHKTMLRINLLKALNPGDLFLIKIKWWYPINNKYNESWPSRSGYEYFAETENYLYAIAQFYPRMAAYYDQKGWQHSQYLGEGEFALEFGDYRVQITLPADYIVAATGMLKNAAAVLTSDQRNRLSEAEDASQPIFIVTPEEARRDELNRSRTKKTWIFEAEQVRDFAFAASRQFIWDAVGVPFGNRKVLAMSFYSKEAMPLWDQYATKAIVHTLQVYSQFTFAYPYPVAIAVQTGNSGGMEYPMISFNGGRPNKDGVFSESLKQRTLAVIMHEVGHNYFPMIVNSDERQWSWMDEGVNTFLEYMAKQSWQEGYPSKRVPANKISDYLSGKKGLIRPVMTQADYLLHYTENAYSKPASALYILREVVLGHDRFDFAFKAYAQRWMFKRPTPADFFRTMEDASGSDLDWFWRGWFFSTDCVDLSLDTVACFCINADSTHEMPADTDKRFYQITVSNIGGLVMPLILKLGYTDKTESLIHIPVEIWRYNPHTISKIIPSVKEIEAIILDPDEQLGDVDMSNNYWQGRLKPKPIEAIQ